MDPNEALPRPIAITMGDVCGIGPEIIAKLFRDERAGGCVVVGDVGAMRRAAAIVGGSLAGGAIEQAGDVATLPPRCIPVLQLESLPADLAELPLGRIDARAGAAAAACIEHAVRLAQRGRDRGDRHRADPQGGAGRRRRPVPRPHRDAAGARGGRRRLPPVRMMLANDELRTVLVTIHVSLRAAIDALTSTPCSTTIRIAHTTRGRAGASRAAHRGRRAQPACRRGRPVRRRGDRASSRRPSRRRAPKASTRRGPFAPDTVFMRARNAPVIRASSTSSSR